MTATALLVELGELGVEVWAEGDRLRYRPRSAVDAQLLERLAANKAALLQQLGHGGARTDLFPPVLPDPLDGPVVEERVECVAWRRYSPQLDQWHWVARDLSTAEGLWTETGLAVFLIEEVPRLNTAPADLLKAIFDTRVVFGPTESRWAS